jgi:hypothetical protein
MIVKIKNERFFLTKKLFFGNINAHISISNINWKNTMKMNCLTIKPAIKGQSDKYSWNLYRFIKQVPRACRVFINNNSEVLIGYPDDTGQLIGTQLSVVLRTSTRTFALWSIGLPPNSGTMEITKEFWERYHLLGACSLEASYHVFVNEGGGRTCSRCGYEEVKRVVMEPREYWESAKGHDEPSKYMV